MFTLAPLLLQVYLASTVAGDCLDGSYPNYVSADKRQNITINQVDMPVGIWRFDWNAPTVLEEVFYVLSREVMGYNTEFVGLGGDSSTGVYAIFGCGFPNGTVQAGCDPVAPGHVHAHIALEAWSSSTSDAMRETTTQKSELAPVNAGSVGYSGTEGLFMTKAVINQAWNTAGLSVDYFRSYNTTWFQPSRFFTAHTEIDTTKLDPCSKVSILSDPARLQTYLDLTGDTAGVINTPDGLRAKCTAADGSNTGSWWLAPGCRADPTTCVPYVSVGGGWGLDSAMQKASHYKMPLALSSAESWGSWGDVVKQYQALFYWWLPDTRFILLDPSRIIFPPHDASAYAAGEKFTAGSGILLWKIAHAYLSRDAPLVYQLLSNFKFYMPTVIALLKEITATGDSTAEVVCKWLKSSQADWTPWIPLRTTCQSQWGLVNSTEEPRGFVMTRAEAQDCFWCSPGTYSSQIDDGGKTHVCKKCEAGEAAVDPGQTMCENCTQGTFSAQEGSSECTRCNTGSYQTAIGRSKCKACPGTGESAMTTDVVGTVLLSDCICPAEFFKPISKATCDPCPLGFECERGSMGINFPKNASEVSRIKGLSKLDQKLFQYPQLLPGQWARFATPLEVYTCSKQSAATCPGGFELCGSPRLVNLVCGECLKGYRRENNDCILCTDFEASMVLFPFLPLCLAPFVILCMYWRAQDQVEAWNSPRNAIAVAFFLMLIHSQTLATLQGCALDFPEVLLGSWSLWQYTNDAVSLFRPACVMEMNFQASFVFGMLGPLYVLVFFLITGAVCYIITSGVRRNIADPDDNKAIVAQIGFLRSCCYLRFDIMFSCYGSIINAFFIGITGQCISLFQCYPHPLPNKARSLRAYSSVLCDSDEWLNMLGVGIAGFMVFCVGSLAIFCWVLVVAPSRFHSTVFQRRWKFLLIKFQPSIWWWGLVILFKGLLLNFTTVLFDSGILQIWWLVLLVVVYQCGALSLVPWRSFSANLLDISMHCFLLFAIGLCCRFAELGQWTATDVARWVLIAGFAPFLIFLVVMLWLAYLILKPPLQANIKAQATKYSETFKKATNVAVMEALLGSLTYSDFRTIREAYQILCMEGLLETPPEAFSTRLMARRLSAVEEQLGFENTSEGSKVMEASGGAKLSNPKLGAEARIPAALLAVAPSEPSVPMPTLLGKVKENIDFSDLSAMNSGVPEDRPMDSSPVNASRRSYDF